MKQTFSMPVGIKMLMLTVTAVGILAASGALYGQSAMPVQSQKNILILNSYTRDNVWTQMEENGFETGLKEQGLSPNIFVEYMATKKFSDQAYFEAFKEMLKVKYSNIKLDCIVTTDDDATVFLAQNRQVIFGKEIPVIYCGINSKIAFPSQFWGIQEKTSIVELIQLIRALHGGDKEIVIATDLTTTSNSSLNDLLMRTTPEFRKNIRIIQENNVERMRKKLNSLDQQVLIFLLFNRDDTGRAYGYLEGYQLFSESIQVPTYSTWDFYMEKGIVGGIFTSGLEQGQKAALLVNRILLAKGSVDKASLDQLSMQLNILGNKAAFDYTQMLKWHISKKSLPKGAHILNEPISYFEENKQLILSGLAVIACLLIVIIYMLRLIQLKNRYQEELFESHARLETVNENLEVLVQEKANELELSYKKLRDAEIKLLEKERGEAIVNLSLQMAHELNTPVGTSVTLLSFIKAEAEAFAANCGNKAEEVVTAKTFAESLIEPVEIIEKSLMRIADYINGLKEKVVAIPETESLPSEIKISRLGIVHHAWDKQGLVESFGDTRLELSISDESLDDQKALVMSEVFRTLMENSFAHAFKNEVKDRPRVVKIAWRTVTSEQCEEMIYEDNGSGIQEQQLRHIFDPMYKADLSKSGTSMGLFNLKSLVENKLGAEVVCESEFGHYTRFILRF